MVFDYPDPNTHCRHGPRGYVRHASYRPWLRDEFVFRCVYCLKRERWGQVTSEFDIDHFQPQSARPDLALDYANLVYACRRCNSVKSDVVVGDPFLVMRRSRVVTGPDGYVRGLDAEATRLVLILDLNSPRLVEWRLTWLRVMFLAAERDPLLFQQLAGFPSDLPELRRLRPPLGNDRPEGIAESWAEQAVHGTLPKYY